MKVQFGKEGTVAAAVAAVTEPLPAGVEETTVVVEGQPVANPATALVPAPPPMPPPAVISRQVVVDDDRILMADLKIPTLNVVQGVGDLCKAFNAGDIVLDKTYLLSPAPSKNPTDPKQKPVRLIVLGFRPTRYAEKIEGGEQGRILSDPQAVERAGGTTVYREAFEGVGKLRKQIKPYFQPLATALILVAAPEGVEKFNEDGVDVVFPLTLEVDGKVTHRFAMAFWHLRGVSHTAVARPLKTHRLGGVLRVKDGYKSRWLSVTTAYKPFDDGHGAFVPGFSIKDPTEPEVRQLAAEVLAALTSAE